MSSKSKRRRDKPGLPAGSSQQTPSTQNQPPHDVSGGNVEQIVHHFSQESHAGPLPHPEILRQYEAIHTGTAERLIKTFEDETLHRRDIVQQAADSQTLRDRSDERIQSKGQLFALIITLAGMTGSVLIGIYGSPWAGSALGGVTLVSIVTAFLTGGSKKQHS